MRNEIDSDHWYTPIDILERVATVYFPRMPFEDPCTCDDALIGVPDSIPIVEGRGDFLATSSIGYRVFMNPPYSRAVGTAGAFTDHLLDIMPDWGEAIVLVNASTDTKWWHRLAQHSAAILFVEGRIKFDRVVDGERVPGGSPRYANCIHYIGKNADLFRHAFSDMGTIR